MIFDRTYIYKHTYTHTRIYIKRKKSSFFCNKKYLYFSWVYNQNRVNIYINRKLRGENSAKMPILFILFSKCRCVLKNEKSHLILYSKKECRNKLHQTNKNKSVALFSNLLIRLFPNFCASKWKLLRKYVIKIMNLRPALVLNFIYRNIF